MRLGEFACLNTGSKITGARYPPPPNPILGPALIFVFVFIAPPFVKVDVFLVLNPSQQIAQLGALKLPLGAPALLTQKTAGATIQISGEYGKGKMHLVVGHFLRTEPYRQVSTNALGGHFGDGMHVPGLRS
jgi:hypothetical protein